MKLFGSVLLVLVFAGCTGPLRFMVKPNTSFDLESEITISCRHIDFKDVGPVLEQLLLSRGFNVISKSVISHRIEYKEKTKAESYGEMTTESEKQAQAERVAEYKSRFVLEFGYGWRFSSFWANVTDLSTGELVATASYRSGDVYRSVSDILEEFVDKLATAVPTRAR